MNESLVYLIATEVSKCLDLIIGRVIEIIYCDIQVKRSIVIYIQAKTFFDAPEN